MSARASIDLRLALGVLLGPVIALLNQQAIYSGATWACGHNARGTLHVIPILCLIGVLIVAGNSYRIWRRSRREDSESARSLRTQFLSIVGVAVTLFSAVVIAAQWMSIFTFDACMRA
jgi:uncharacterized membrane protein YidH (DUF202 family)